jgi:hypothetical protein
MHFDVFHGISIAEIARTAGTTGKVCERVAVFG